MGERIKRFVLTGGPCGWKTTFIDRLADVLPRDHGITPIFVPEIPTLADRHGIKIRDIIQSPAKNQAMQREFFGMVIENEDHFGNLAKLVPAKKKGIFEDRGLYDNSPYSGDALFMNMLAERGLDYLTRRDQYYDAVLHSRSAAIGAPQFYDLKNPARYEDLEQAAKTDEKTLLAWLGHPHLRILPNVVEPGDKIEDVIERKFNALLKEILFAFEGGVEIERKYRVGRFFGWEIPVPHVSFMISQTYLESEESSRRVRTRRQIHPEVPGVEYVYTEKREIAGRIGKAEQNTYLDGFPHGELFLELEKSTKTIKKKRHVFVHEDQIFELDAIISPRVLNVLEIELSSEHQTVNLPPWLPIIEEVTGRRSYSNHAIAAGAEVGEPSYE